MMPGEDWKAKVLCLVTLWVNQRDKMIFEQGENETRIPVYMIGVSTVICLN